MGDRPGTVGPQIAVLLGPQWTGIGRPVVSLARTSSTNDHARSLARIGAAHGTSVVADRQTSGRGRLARVWFSPRGLGLWCSVILRPRIAAAHLGPLPLAAALAVARGIKAATGFQCAVKWPNDLMAGDLKLGGILSEAAVAGERRPPEFVLLGIGVNVLQAADDFPPELRDRASSLLIEGFASGPAEVGAAVLRELDGVYRTFEEAGFAALKNGWVSLATMIGCRVRVSGAGGELTGIAEGIDEHGRLLLTTTSGRTVALAAGDLSLRRKEAPGEGPACFA